MNTQAVTNESRAYSLALAVSLAAASARTPQSEPPRALSAPASPEPRASEPVDATIDGLVGDLRRLYRGSGLPLMVEIGGLVFERIYGGDVERWHTRGRKDVSFRKLSRHPGLPFRASTLSRAVAMHLLVKRRPSLIEARHLGSGHLQEVLGLDLAAQDRLLTLAEAEQWSVQHLRSQARLARAGLRTVAPKPSALGSTLRQLKHCVNWQRLLADAEKIRQLPLREAEELLQLTRRVRQGSERLSEVLEERLGVRENPHPASAQVAP